jgi:hypothetical protein
MTDRHAGYLVTLGQSVREDDAEAIVTALKMVKGVVKVTPVTATPELDIAEARVQAEWRDRVWKWLHEARS